ncbi:SNF2-related protein [Dermabacter sp. Marseille-Q3180]|uniref:SNF2-related protein n=1 Tax=Dermabacter sp. Marseille-Q3180 TaxID=2758090 RepID=UPI002024E3C7|nr:SNF2-related protein [Dermabacter sp. Marseille-Q3180]
MSATPIDATPNVSGVAAMTPPGSLVRVRDETWLVTSVEETSDGALFTVRGVSDFVEGIEAQFYESLDRIVPVNPRAATLVGDASPHYRKTRLWLESTLRKTPVPIAHPGLTVAPRMLADDLPYQREAVEAALDPERLRPRLLIADAVGLGKTLEIGMILTELMRRGRGRRVLIVCPKHVLEQMQHEMWVRFALPFVRLDSQGVQAVKQKLPATSNPFSYFEKVIISIDTLKQERFVHDLRSHTWDAVVIDESHNVTNQSTQNNQLARILAPNTDALILASATPHNGKNESFAQLMSLLEPTSVSPQGEVEKDTAQKLMIRRHRYSDSVKDVVGERWQPRKDPVLTLAEPSEAEREVALEIARTWTHPGAAWEEGERSDASIALPGSFRAPSATGRKNALFPWVLMEAFLSSPSALAESVSTRLAKIEGIDSQPAKEEREALTRLKNLNDRCLAGNPLRSSGKFQRLIKLLKEKGVGPGSDERIVIFAERVKTLEWLKESIEKALKFPKAAKGQPFGPVTIMHGGLQDSTQQAIVESFKQKSSPIRVLVTGDVASEGVNLHSQCHELVHYDIPWSLIRLEQRNGRIDRYGQRVAPQITALLLDLTGVPGSDGDVRVLERLLERENEAHTLLGDAASLMDKYSVSEEKNSVVEALRGTKDIDEVLPEPAQAVTMVENPFLSLILAGNGAGEHEEARGHRAEREAVFDTGLFDSEEDFVRTGLAEVFGGNEQRDPSAGGVGLTYDSRESLLEFTPPSDLVRRLEFLPQSYVRERGITHRIALTSDANVANGSLARAREGADGTLWPAVHYLSPLHPVVEWVADRALARHDQGTIPVIKASVGAPWVFVQALLTAENGQTVHTELLAVAMDGETPRVMREVDPAELFDEIGLCPDIPGTEVREPEQYAGLLAAALTEAEREVRENIMPAITRAARDRAEKQRRRLMTWDDNAKLHPKQTQLFRHTSSAVRSAKSSVDELVPKREFVRPLLVAVPRA